MKKNTKTYVLLAAVLGIWGAIGYQIITGLNPDEPELTETHLDVSFSPKTNKAIDTFSIQTADRDPFLGTLARKRTVPKATKKIVQDTMWMPIVYNGLVKRQNSSERVFVVNISNTQHLLKQGQTINGLTLLRGSEKQIVVRYKNKRKTIPVQ